MSATKSQVYELVDQGGTIVKEVFSSVVGSESKATREAAVVQFDVYCKEVLRAHPYWGSLIKGAKAKDSLLSRFNLNEIIDLIEAADSRLHRQLFNQIVSSFPSLRSLMIRVGAFLYDLDASRLIELRASDLDKYKDVGKGIILAGLYLSLDD